ncbi:MAG: response regulator [Candidatus Limnocylindria bacterium]
MYRIPRAGNPEATSRPAPRAFVVEDDIPTLQLLRDVARAAGLEPLAFTRLSTAREALRRQTPAVMVVDDDLPDGQGADLVLELRRDPRTRHVRVIFCTGADARRRQEIGRLAPVIAKPFALHDVERALAELAATH